MFCHCGKVFTLKNLLSKYFPQMEMATAELEPAKETRCEVNHWLAGGAHLISAKVGEGELEA